MSDPAPVVVPAFKYHTASVIMLHGLGDSGAGWIFLAENWSRRGKFEEVAFIFPNAPSIPVTMNFGMRMPAWYDMSSLSNLDPPFDEPGIMRSRTAISSLITAEIGKGIPSNRILLGGFSQGGGLALLTGITCPDELGGIFGLSCCLLLPTEVRDLVPEENVNEKTKIWMGHGDSDQIVKHESGRETATLLEEWGWDVEFRIYKGLEHSAGAEEIEHLEEFIRGRLTNPSHLVDPPESKGKSRVIDQGAEVLLTSEALTTTDFPSAASDDSNSSESPSSLMEQYHLLLGDLEELGLGAGLTMSNSTVASQKTMAKEAKIFYENALSSFMTWGTDIRIESGSFETIRNTIFATVIHDVFLIIKELLVECGRKEFPELRLQIDVEENILRL